MYVFHTLNPTKTCQISLIVSDVFLFIIMSVDYSFTLREDYQHAVGQANKLMNSGL